VLLASTLGGAPPLLAAESREEPKQKGMTADQMLQKIKEDFQQRQYYVTGKTSAQLIAPPTRLRSTLLLS